MKTLPDEVHGKMPISTRKGLLSSALALLVALTLIVSACASSPSPTANPSPTASSSPAVSPSPTVTAPKPGGGAIINSDSVVTAKIQAIRQQTSGYPWELDVLIENSIDVGALPNPTKESVGKVITVKTDQDMTAFKVGDVVNARVKYVGDVPRPGITLYIYDIAKEVPP